MDRYIDVETAETFGRDETDERILDFLRRHGTHSLDELSVVLPEVGWSRVFLAIDRLSREGKVTIGPPQRGDYQVSASPADGLVRSAA
jgi:hypothetical protein